MENSLVPEAASITDSANTSPYFSANSHCWGCWTQVTKTSPEESKEYLAYFVQGVLAISPSIFKIIVSRERSIDVPGDGTVLWRFLPEKGSNMQVKTHPKNINSNMVGLRLGRLALGSVHCCKFSKSQCTPAELAVADYSWDRFGYLSTSGEVRERQKELTHTHTHTQSICVPARAVQMQPPLRDPWMPALPRDAPGISQLQESQAAVSSCCPKCCPWGSAGGTTPHPLLRTQLEKTDE